MVQVVLTVLAPVCKATVFSTRVTSRKSPGRYCFARIIREEFIILAVILCLCVNTTWWPSESDVACCPDDFDHF